MNSAKNYGLTKRAAVWLSFLLIGVFVCFSGFFRPYHNWDEIPYAFLTANTECNAPLHAAHYRYLEQRVPSLYSENSKLRASSDSSYRKRALSDADYFCSNLPFYTTKKLYVRMLRFSKLLTGDALQSVRLASALPAVLWYLVMGIVVTLWSPGGAFAKVPLLLLVGRIGEVLARLSTPDSLGCLLLASSALGILLVIRHDRQNPSIRLRISPWFLTAVLLAALSILVRANLALALIFFACSLMPFARRGIVIAFAGFALMLSAFLAKSLSGLLYGYPDSYSHLTLLMFHSGGLFGPSGDPAADIRQMNGAEIFANLDKYLPNLFQIFKSSIKSVLAGLRQLVGYLAVIFLSTFSKALISRYNFSIEFLVSNVFCFASALIGLGYLVQVAVFPLADIRMIAPYVSLVVLSCCLLVVDPSWRVGMNLAEARNRLP